MTIDQRPVPGRATIVAYALLFPLFALVVVTREMGLLTSDDAKRAVGIVLAMLLAVTGNFLPKLLHPDREAAAALHRQRRSAWGLVLTGLALVVVLLIAPADRIERWSGIVGLGGLSLVFIDALVQLPAAAVRSTRRADRTAIEIRHAATRQAALYIVHAIGWVFAMFLADDLWGDAAAIWMVVAFTISNGLLAVGNAAIALAREPSH